ncbi:hypothetical protein MY10362_006162 [Beauveria mimosiformis]
MARLHCQPERRVHALRFMSATTKANGRRCMELAHFEVDLLQVLLQVLLQAATNPVRKDSIARHTTHCIDLGWSLAPSACSLTYLF